MGGERGTSLPAAGVGVAGARGHREQFGADALVDVTEGVEGKRRRRVDVVLGGKGVLIDGGHGVPSGGAGSSAPPALDVKTMMMSAARPRS